MTENKSLLSTILVIIIVGLCFFWFRQIGPGNVGSPEIKNKDIIEHIKFLSDDKRAGRYPGTRESKDVIAYIINQFKTFGIQQAGEGSSFKQTFSILDSVKRGKNNSLKINDRPLSIEKDYIPLWFSGNASLSGDVVFAGYGINMITDSLIWNDYKDLDIGQIGIYSVKKNTSPFISIKDHTHISLNEVEKLLIDIITDIIETNEFINTENPA